MNKPERKLMVLASVSCLNEYVDAGNLCTLQFTLPQLQELANTAYILGLQGYFCAERASEYNLRVYESYHPDILINPCYIADENATDWESDELEDDLRVDCAYLKVYTEGSMEMTWYPRHGDERERCTAVLPDIQTLITEFNRAFPGEVTGGR